jgi:hypothetical protein
MVQTEPSFLTNHTTVSTINNRFLDCCCARCSHSPSNKRQKASRTMLFFQSAIRKAIAPSRRFFHASSKRLEKLNVEGLAKRVDLKGQNVLVRVDLNVPLAKVSDFRFFPILMLKPMK